MEKFVMYVGLNDKETKRQEISTEKAIDIICKILAKQGITDLTLNQGMGKPKSQLLCSEDSLTS